MKHVEQLIGNCVVNGNYVKISAFVLGTSHTTNASNKYQYSTDKTTTFNSTTSSTGWRGGNVAYAGGRFLAYGSSSSCEIRYSDDCGKTWTSTGTSSSTTIIGGTPVDVQHTFVRLSGVLTSGGVKLLYSDDGITWSDAHWTGTSDIVVSNSGTKFGEVMAYGRGSDGTRRFLAVRLCTTTDTWHWAVSVDGHSWEGLKALPPDVTHVDNYGVWYMNNKFITRSSYKTSSSTSEKSCLLCSRTGYSGIARITTTNLDDIMYIYKILKMVHGNVNGTDYYVIVTTDNRVFVTTQDVVGYNEGTTSAYFTWNGWTEVTSKVGTMAAITDLCFGDGVFIIVAKSVVSATWNTLIYRASNPTGTWTQTQNIASSNGFGIAYGQYK